MQQKSWAIVGLLGGTKVQNLVGAMVQAFELHEVPADRWRANSPPH